jgi:hypothetical protein
MDSRTRELMMHPRNHPLRMPPLQPDLIGQAMLGYQRPIDRWRTIPNIGRAGGYTHGGRVLLEPAYDPWYRR